MKVTESSQWTAANIVTCIRVLFVPIWFMAAEGAATSAVTGSFSLSSLAVAFLFVVLSLTDSIDGYLARSRNEVTTFGKFLDPIADKLVVITGLLYLLEQGLVPTWALVVVIAREFLVSGLRMLVATSGTVIAASNLGKLKTATTMVAITGLLLVLAFPDGGFASFLRQISNIALYLAVILTAWSGVDYFIKSKDAIFAE